LEVRPEQRPAKWNWGVDGRLVVAWNAHWKLPHLLEEEIASPIASSRVAAVDWLTQLGRVGSATVRERVLEALGTLAGDDSKRVCEAASKALAFLSTPAEAQ